MSSELENRLARALRALPGPTADARQRARSAALSAVSAERRRSGWSRAVLVAAALLVLLAVGAGALAAVGTLHVRVGPDRQARSAALRLQLPAGARGIAVVAGGRLWLTMRGGTRIEGLPVSAAELSPRALYVAAGIGRSLVAMAPNGRRAWALPTAGTVAAIAWSPDGLRVAYVVRGSHGAQLRLVEGDGDHDRLLDPSVRPVRPSWRADSLALAYVGAGGRAVVADLGRRTHHVVAGARAVSTLAYSPEGRRLAVVDGRGVAVGSERRVVRWRAPAPGRVNAIAWVGRRLVAAVGPRLYAASGSVVATAPAPLQRVAALPSGEVVGAIRRGSATELRLLAPGDRRALSRIGAALAVAYLAAR